MRVLTGTEHPGTSDAWIALWQAMHGDIAAEAVEGGQMVIEVRRDEVSEVIRSVLP